MSTTQPSPTPTPRTFLVGKYEDIKEVVLASEHQAALAAKDAEIEKRRQGGDLWCDRCSLYYHNEHFGCPECRAERAEAFLLTLSNTMSTEDFKQMSTSKLAQIKRLYVSASKVQRWQIRAWFREQDFADFVDTVKRGQKMTKKTANLLIK